MAVNSTNDPRSIIELGPMRAWQWLAVLVTVGLNAIDGFDVLSISFASPGIARSWGIDKASLGWVLSTELIGMALGSVVLGSVADRLGRRPLILGCLVAMVAGMSGAAGAGAVPTLVLFRFLTGLGIGGMLAAINALAAELANRRWRSFAMALMVIGYPLGGVLGGLAVQRILAHGDWRDIFRFGAWATAAFLPIVWWLAPESVEFLERRRPAEALARINRILARFGHPPVGALGAAAAATRRSLADIFRPQLLATTLLVTVAYFAHITTFYFLLKWVPKIVVDLGYEPRAAAGVLTWMNVGGATGGALFGLIAARVGLKRLTIVTLLGAVVMTIRFGHGAVGLGSLTAIVALAGLCNNSAIVGLYALFATVFPTHVRATGTGFAIGIGRGGAALAPVVAGYLLQAGLGLQRVALVMAMGSLVAAVVLLKLRVAPPPATAAS
jgi:benzoate transport